MTRPTPLAVHMANIAHQHNRRSRPVLLSFEIICLALAISWVGGVFVGALIGGLR